MTDAAGGSPMRTQGIVVMLSGQYLPEVYGGAQRQCAKQAAELARRGHRVLVLTSRESIRTPARESGANGVEVRRIYAPVNPELMGRNLPVSLLWMLRVLGCLWRRRGDIRLIHVHQLKFGAFVGALAGQLFGIPVVTKPGNAGAQSDTLRLGTKWLVGPAMSQFVANKTDRFCAISNTIADELASVGISDDRIVRVNNGVEVSASLAELLEHKRTALAKHDGKWEFVFIGRLEAIKRVDVLIKAFAAACGGGTGCRLTIAGDGSLAPELRRLANSLAGVDIRFAGYIPDLAPILSNAHFVVLSSEAEGMSNAVLEGMAAAIVPISTPVSGSLDIIEDGRNGYLSRGFSVENIADAIRSAVPADFEHFAAMATRAYHAVTESYSIEAVVDRYEQVYDGVANAVTVSRQ